MQERKALIVEFVENYRASNEGKFPTVTNTRQQIGGSYYTVRDVLQEMVYNHAKLPLDNPKPAPLQETDEVTKHPMQRDEDRVLESHEILEVPDQSMAEDDAEVGQRQGTAEVYENFLPKDEGKVDQFQGRESESFKDNPKLEESANTGLLGSLKSFAYGIRDFWKNM